MARTVPENAMLIPENAERVFGGVIYDVYQWPQKMFDGSMATYEMLKRPDTVQFICIKNDKIIVTQEQQSGRPSYLRFPGGRVEPGETWEAAVARECLEELGMEFANAKLIAVRQPIMKIEWFVATYILADLSSEQEPSPDAGEKIEILEMSLADLKAALATETNPLLDYAKEFFSGIDSLEDLRNLPEFQGKEIT